MHTLENYITELCALSAPSGEEDEVFAWLRKHWLPFGKLEEKGGNLLMHMDGGGKPFLVVAHADEISFMVRFVTSKGFLKVIKGQSDNWNLPHFLSQPVTVLGSKGKIPGVFCGATGHILNSREKKTVENGDNYFVDIGANSKEEVAEMGIHQGCRIVWDVSPLKMGDKIFAKAIDDRVGLALLTCLAQRMAKREIRPSLIFVATSQEELGYVGASSLGCEKHAGAVVIDNGLSGDIPGIEEGRINVEIGKGPILVYRDSGVHYTRKFILKAESVAEKSNIPFQRGVFFNYATDGAAFIRNGLDTMLVAPPVRYTHSPREMVSLKDVYNTLELIEAFLLS